ncbi:TauD/TfdA family dioxygenase [Nocardia puris]|uniref:TauD/TfdA family dioxygenase n=1 Tax=Nocardia puris TaxID=208602 RepID=UPI002E1D4C4A
MAADEATLAEFTEYLAGLDDPATLIDTIDRSDVDLPHLAALTERLRSQLFGRFGFAHLVGLAAGGFSEPQLRLLYVLVCLHLGQLYTSYGRLHDVADRGLDFRTTDVSVSATRVRAPFHTDSTSQALFPNVFGLMCLRPAMSGGESLLSSACQAYQQIAETSPQHLPSLFADHPRNPVTPDGRSVTAAENAYPIFTWDRFAPGPTLRYMRHWIETGYAQAGLTVPDRHAAAFDALDNALEDGANVLSVAMSAGEAIFFNNALVAHNRTEFHDHPEPGRGRLLARAWLDARSPDVTGRA